MESLTFSVGPAEFGFTRDGGRSCRSGDTEILLTIRPDGDVKMTVLVYAVKWSRACKGGAGCVCIRTPSAGWMPDPACRTIYIRGERSLQSVSTHDSLSDAQAAFRRMIALGYDGVDLHQSVDWSDCALALASATWVVDNRVLP